jgi:hypothetical protein
METVLKLVVFPLLVTLVVSILLWLGACFVSLEIVSFYTGNGGGLFGRIALAITYGFAFLAMLLD